MNRLLSKKYILTVAATLIIAGALTYLFKYHEGSPASMLANNSERPARELPPRISAPVSNLIADKKVDSDVIRRQGPKAFSIVRNKKRPPGDVAKYIESLLQRSEAGDAVATYSIYLAALECKTTLSGSANRSALAHQVSAIGAGYLKSAESSLDDCANLASKPELLNGDWLKKAAEQGSLEAQLMYSRDAASVIGSRQDYLKDPEKLVQYKKDAARYLEGAAQQGSIDALLAIAGDSQRGIMAPMDPVKSAAYYMAAQKTGSNTYLDKIVDSYSNTLSRDQMRAAGEQAEAIYENCCR
ncbi:hypothetical protein [Xanthomonas arboricola]|uniref:hypothetical protein n=1 Tax=Xanthomonas arboricola TaxID=56448 RepID=UPI002018B74B|nr:hypothetical protein [Xanthomonas arboricola]